MSTASERAPFNEAEFLADLSAGSLDLQAPFDMDTVRTVIQAFDDAFHDSALQIRCGQRPKTSFMIRALFAIPVDAIGVALKQKWVKEDDPIVRINRALNKACPRSLDEPEFLTDTGFDGVWKFLGGVFAVDQVLAIPEISEGIKAHLPKFKELGLVNTPAIHLSFSDQTVDVYFLAQGPLKKEHLTQVVAMAGAPEPSDGVYANLVGVLLNAPYYCTVCMDYESGKVTRVEYHLLFPIRLPKNMEIPEVGERLEKFWDIPSYDIEAMDIISFCFGDTPVGDILALRSYVGGTRSLMKAWGIVGV